MCCTGEVWGGWMGMSENENARGTEGFRKLVCVRGLK